MDLAEWKRGEYVHLLTITGETIKGIVHDMDRNIVVVQPLKERIPSTRGGGPKFAYVMQKAIRHSRKLESLKLTPVPIPKVDSKTQAAIARNSINVRRSEQSRIGVDVSKRGQALFDFLAKTMDCRWDGKTIIVHNDVYVSPPYISDSCRGQKPKGTDHVKKTVERAWKKLDLASLD